MLGDKPTIVICSTYGGGAFRPTYEAYTGRRPGRPDAHCQLELLGDKHFAVHISTHVDLRRTGLCSMLVDFAVKQMAKDGRALLFEDEQLYRDLHGRGGFSPNGQAWADAYRLKRGLPLPPTQFDWPRWQLVSRQEARDVR